MAETACLECQTTSSFRVRLSSSTLIETPDTPGLPRSWDAPVSTDGSSVLYLIRLTVRDPVFVPHTGGTCVVTSVEVSVSGSGHPVPLHWEG